MMNKLIAIVGPTASGRPRSRRRARTESRPGFEAINADSRQVYRHMDIGTAKPTAEERAALPHHLIDVVDPDEPFGLASWLNLANEALTAVWESAAAPVLVGGTGQYVWRRRKAGASPEVPPNDELRRELGGASAGRVTCGSLRRVDPESDELIQPQTYGG